MRTKILAGVCFTLAFACRYWSSRDLVYDNASEIERSARRTTVAGRAVRDCRLNPGPAADALIELLGPRTGEVMASTRTDHSGLFVLRTDYLKRPDEILFLRFEGFRMELPAAAYNSFNASVLVPCTTGDRAVEA